MTAKEHIEAAEDHLERRQGEMGRSYPPDLTDVTIAVAHIGIALQLTIQDGLREFREFRRSRR